MSMTFCKAATAIALFSIPSLLTAKPAVTASGTAEGRVPPPITQEHFQPETTTRESPVVLRPLATTSASSLEILGSDRFSARNSKARLALEKAEIHLGSCDLPEANRWYAEVIRLAPRSVFALAAAERLTQIQLPAAGLIESREPPLAR